MIRSLLVVMACLGAVPAHAATAATADLQAACTSPAAPGDRREVSCVLPASDAPRRFRYRVTFLGGHDDTKASIEFAIDGKARDCEAGSKTSLFGEDGEVSLSCDFTIEPAAGAKRVATLTIVWTHAQYKDFALMDR